MRGDKKMEPTMEARRSRPYLRNTATQADDDTQVAIGGNDLLRSAAKAYQSDLESPLTREQQTILDDILERCRSFLDISELKTMRKYELLRKGLQNYAHEKGLKLFEVIRELDNRENRNLQRAIYAGCEKLLQSRAKKEHIVEVIEAPPEVEEEKPSWTRDELDILYGVVAWYTDLKPADQILDEENCKRMLGEAIIAYAHDRGKDFSEVVKAMKTNQNLGRLVRDKCRDIV